MNLKQLFDGLTKIRGKMYVIPYAAKQDDKSGLILVDDRVNEAMVEVENLLFEVASHYRNNAPIEVDDGTEQL